MSGARGERIYLVGLSGSGKSTVAPILAAQLGWSWVDTDVLVETHVGKSIPEIFNDEGEDVFRAFEASVLDEVGSMEEVVVSTGGGAPTTERCRRVIRDGFSVWLQIDPEAAAKRISKTGPYVDGEERPLTASDPAVRLREMLEQRTRFYSEAKASMPVAGLSPEEIAAEVAALWTNLSAAPNFQEVARVSTAHAKCPIFVQPGLIAQLGALCVDLGISGRAFIITDDQVQSLYGGLVEASLAEAGFEPSMFAIPAGEEHKTLATVETVYDWLLERRVERSDFVVCVGGGVVTDLGGFVAATCLRGLPFVHVPTTLLAMSDAAVGGKTGVDHRLGKNMVGAFVQPSAVAMDTDVLETLPERQIRAGMAEVIKHGFILDADLVADLEAADGELGDLLSPELIARSVAIKAAVVSEDERESGTRELLNYGHTVGHAIETVTGYERFQHGEAVALGMRAAGLIARALGMLSADDFYRQQRLLEAAGLPDAAPGLDVDEILAAMRRDKKVRGGKSRFVLLEEIGRAAVIDDVPQDIVRAAIETVVA